MAVIEKKKGYKPKNTNVQKLVRFLKEHKDDKHNKLG
jgi:hypothetical protein